MRTIAENRIEMPAEPSTSRPADSTVLNFLDSRKLHFSVSGALLRMTIENECTHLKVGVFRAFPLSLPHRYYSVRDGAGKEIGLIADPSTLSEENRKLVEADLQRRYLVTTIRSVRRLEERFGAVDWHVETNRGPCRFTTRNLRESVLCPEPGQYLLTDVDGNRYEVANIDSLDTRSRGLLLRYL